ncbi:MAG: hypothetical protein HY318_14490 [Armatimonadetes bacterium]|nr:hypothetical protein [Armatimonadota bacterium]
MGTYSDMLFARPSFIEGVARLMDLGCTLQDYNRSLTPEEADFLALRSDWCAVGNELRLAMQQAEDELDQPFAESIVEEARALLESAATR